MTFAGGHVLEDSMTMNVSGPKEIHKRNTSSAKIIQNWISGRTCKNCRSHQLLAVGPTDWKIGANKQKLIAALAAANKAYQSIFHF